MNRTTTPTTPSARQGAPFTPMAPMPLARVIDQFFSDDPFFALAPVTINSFNREASTGFALDFGEDENNYLVKASLPGFTEGEITAEVNDGVLTIRAEKSEESSEDTDKTWHRRERRWGSMVRQIQLPAPVMEDQAQAELTHGVLTLRLPKVQKAPAKRITINGQRGTEAAPRQDTAHTVNGSSTSQENRTNRMSGAR